MEESAHLLRERVISLFTQSQHLCHGLWNKRRITQSCQVNPGEAISKTCAEVVGDLEREPGLAYPTRPSHRQQTHTALLQEAKCLGDLLLPPKQSRRRVGKHLQGSSFRVISREGGSCGCEQLGPLRGC